MSRRTIFILVGVAILAALFPLLGLAAALIGLGYGLATPRLRTMPPGPRTIVPTTKHRVRR